MSTLPRRVAWDLVQPAPQEAPAQCPGVRAVEPRGSRPDLTWGRGPALAELWVLG